MIVLGIILIIVGLLLPQFGILETIGIILLLIGVVLWFLPMAGRPVGRGVYRGRYW